MTDLLFFEVSSRAQGEIIRTHAHDFWQLDLVVAGRYDTSVDHRSYTCDVGDALFIPPGSRHGLICRSPAGESIVLKFRTDAVLAEDLPYLLPRTRLTTLVLDLVRSLVATPPPASPVVPANTEVANRQIALLIDLLWHEAYGRPTVRPPRRRQGLVDKIDHYLLKRQGGYVTVDELANHLDYSPSHTSRRFRAERGVVLKDYLDQRRAAVCRDLLLYSELTIAEIADQLEFPDLPSFSRFVRRHLQAAPRVLRASAPPPSQTLVPASATPDY